MNNSPRRALLGLLAAAFVSGCASQNLDTENALEMVDSPAELNTPKPEWKTPFWERGASDQGAVTAFQRRDEPLNNVGVLVQGQLGNADAFWSTLTEGAPEHGFVIVPTGTLRDALSNTQGCGNAPLQSESCLDGLTTYPGVRLLVEVVPAGQNQLQVSLRDTTREGVSTVTLGTDSNGGANALLDELAARADSARWSVRAFDGGDGHVYIPAGRRNGLALGTELEVRQPGQAIQAPSGQVIGWRPGAVAGKVKVTQWVGEGLAVVETTSGSAPSPNDWLTLPRKKN
ncbi:hypothetical protein [Alloalcanivorax xenomutans]|jgi:hypothetical protein|uniref:hypothetical protein n=1 Tax=Alloalcanivorax xenomutans TaxID=1094342 RepID=UPI0003B829D3|nr:hypothetical protein [Alloalcanivorax xenomutans]ERS14337.1 hypothetical protein Q668_10325 [Alcanivorax sp. PN-3]MBA4719902.1 hypothetical protein [Alcanivorax sp.]WOA31251.1 hypothetical protein RVY87_20625 [Alloalcanivorax xenomutans]